MLDRHSTHRLFSQAVRVERKNGTTRSMAQLDIEKSSELYFARIHRAALVLTGNPWDADDLAQETFLTAARQGHRFEGRSSPYTWLYGILLNLERRRLRSTAMRRNKLRVLWGEEPAEERSSPPAETPVEVAEWKQSLWALVARLPDGQRQSLVLRFSEQLRYDEIAAVMNCPLGTVKSRVFNGLASLRESLAEAGSPSIQVPDHVWADVKTGG